MRIRGVPITPAQEALLTPYHRAAINGDYEAMVAAIQTGLPYPDETADLPAPLSIVAEDPPYYRMATLLCSHFMLDPLLELDHEMLQRSIALHTACSLRDPCASQDEYDVALSSALFTVRSTHLIATLCEEMTKHQHDEPDEQTMRAALAQLKARIAAEVMGGVGAGVDAAAFAAAVAEDEDDDNDEDGARIEAGMGAELAAALRATMEELAAEFDVEAGAGAGAGAGGDGGEVKDDAEGAVERAMREDEEGEV